MLSQKKWYKILKNNKHFCLSIDFFLIFGQILSKYLATCNLCHRYNSSVCVKFETIKYTQVNVTSTLNRLNQQAKKLQTKKKKKKQTDRQK